MAKKSSSKHRENSGEFAVSSSIKLCSLSFSLYISISFSPEKHFHWRPLSVLSLVKFCGAAAVGVARWCSRAGGAGCVVFGPLWEREKGFPRSVYKAKYNNLGGSVAVGHKLILHAISTEVGPKNWPICPKIVARFIRGFGIGIEIESALLSPPLDIQLGVASEGLLRLHSGFNRFEIAGPTKPISGYNSTVQHESGM